jgi:hypothetical protein
VIKEATLISVDRILEMMGIQLEFLEMAPAREMALEATIQIAHPLQAAPDLGLDLDQALVDAFKL